MNIEKIKINGSGYLVNDVLYVPALTDDIKQWLEEGNTPEPEFTDDELNQQRISLIKRKAGNVISSKYSIIKQLNISNLLDGYSEEDKTKMIAFINSIRAISNKAELEGTALEDIDWGVL
jgi:hypothetical protein